mgnify:CR=1 FL=1
MTDGKATEADAAGPKRERGATTIYSSLREDILTLRLAPGSAIDEVAIARQFGLSRTPVREALVMLSGEGLVRFLPNRSSIIAPLTMENMNDYFDTLLILTRSIMVAAATKRAPEDGDRLRQLLSVFRESIGQEDVFRIVFAQLDLLKGFSRVARNDFLGKFFPDCLDYGRRTMLLHYFPFVRHEDLAFIAETYARLIEAVEAGDAVACNEIVSEQLNSVVRVVQKSLEPTVAEAVDLSTDSYPRFQNLRSRR